MKRIEIQPRVHLNVMSLNKFKTNYISIELRLPLRKETAAHYALIPKVLDRGCARYPDLMSLSRRTEELYGTGISAYSYKSGEGQHIALSAYPLSNDYAIDGMDILGETVDLMGQMLLDPVMENGVFLEEYVENEKHNLIDAIRAEINDKTRYAFNRAVREMCRDEAFSIAGTGTIEDVEAITPRSLTDAWKQALDTAKIEIWAIGNMDSDALAKTFSDLLRQLPAGEAAPSVTEVRRHAEGEIREIDEVQPMKQGNLVMGFRSGRILDDGADYTAFTVFLSVFGAGTTSKLFMNVRERMSLCYYCSASVDALKGLMYVRSGIEYANYDVAKKAILDQLDAICRGDVTEEELENAKIGIVNRYRELSDEAGSMKGWYATRLLAGRNDSPEECAGSVMQVTLEQVVNAAKGVSLDTVYFLHGDPTENEESNEEEAEA